MSMEKASAGSFEAGPMSHATGLGSSFTGHGVMGVGVVGVPEGVDVVSWP